jgi:hypothetical protein
MEIAVSIAHALAVVLILRAASPAARAAAPISGTAGKPDSTRRSAASSRLTSRRSSPLRVELIASA